MLFRMQRIFVVASIEIRFYLKAKQHLLMKNENEAWNFILSS